VPASRELKLTKPRSFGASQLKSGVRRTPCRTVGGLVRVSSPTLASGAVVGRLAGVEADAAVLTAFGGMVARMDMPPHARAGRIGRGHSFAA
jgi:hypothetical protein